MARILLALVETRTNQNSVVALTGAVEASAIGGATDVIYLRPPDDGVPGDGPRACGPGRRRRGLPSLTAQLTLLAGADAAVIGFSFLTADLVEVAAQVAALRSAFERGPAGTRGDAPLRTGRPLLLAGGAHASAEPVETLGLGFDLVLRGEAEESLPSLLAALLGEGDLDTVPGLVRIVDGVVRKNVRAPAVDLDAHPPFAPFHRRFGPFEITRGCPFACRFCQTSYLMGARMRHRSVEGLVEAGRRARRLGLKDLRMVTPDAFAYGSPDGRAPAPADLERLLVGLSGVFGREHVFCGSFPSEVRPESVTPETVGLVRRLAANDNVVLGAQSGSDAMLRRLHRGHDVEAVLRAVDTIRAAGLLPIVDFIYGLPGEEEADRVETRAFMQRVADLGAIVHGHVFMPLPGTPFGQAPPAPVDTETRDLLDVLAGRGMQIGKWRAQEQTALRVAAFRDGRS
jgi:B12-binding domain/radical SAM domain protein